MLAGGTDTLYRNMLASGVRRYTRVDVYDGNGNKLTVPPDYADDYGGVAFESGQITASLTSRVVRNLGMIVPQQLYPATVNGILAPYGNRLKVTSGIELGDGSLKYTWTSFYGRIQKPLLTPDGRVYVPAADRANEVVEYGFLLPENSQVGNSVNAEFVRLVSGAVSSPVFGASDTFAQTMPQLTWSVDRAAALDEIATSVGAFWYALANGSFVLRRYPWTVAASPVVTISDGVNGIMSGAPSRDRNDVWNSITVTGERADGTTPVYAVAEDTNPASPTYVNGPFGRRHRTISLQTPQTQGSAQTAANEWLKRSVALQETWTWDQVPDAALELGDVVSINAYDRVGVIQVVSGFTLPLETSSSMSVQAHAQIVGALE